MNDSQFADRSSIALGRRACAAAFAALLASGAMAPGVYALSLSDLTNKEAVSGLKEALIRGATEAQLDTCTVTVAFSCGGPADSGPTNSAAPRNTVPKHFQKRK